MKCLKCGRKVVRFTASIVDSSGEEVGWGPKCARDVLAAGRRKVRAARAAARAQRVDENQLALPWGA